MRKDFFDNGFTNVLKIDLGNTLTNLQNKIYSCTKEHIIDHDSNLPLVQKIKLPFKKIPDKAVWSRAMNELNNSSELEDVINSNEILDKFKSIFKTPKRFNISFFRARFPDQERAIYDWHQDEGTWYMSNDKRNLNKFAATLWFSINGANKQDSIQLVKKSHKHILYNHTFIKGQGYFSAKLKEFKFDDNLICTVETNPSEAVIFHPLTLHRSVPYSTNKLRPRYSIDIRYYDENEKLNYKTNFLFKLKKKYSRIREWMF